MSKQQIRLAERSPNYWRATFDHPPVNLIGPETLRELSDLIDRMEAARELRVVVFESANPDFFLAHWDVTSGSVNKAAKYSDLPPWSDTLARLSQCGVISIAALRGCARGAGSEFALACDLRFASRERTVLAQFEAGVGAVPGGGPMARLSRLVGRGRALEILLGADDFSGELAERYGYVNRALPDAELDAFVDTFANRLARFDKWALGEIKRIVDVPTLPTDDELALGTKAFFNSVHRPEAQVRVRALIDAGLQQRSDTELHLGRHL